MKKDRILKLLSLIALLIVWKNYIPTHSIVGQYVNNNTEALLEGPRPIQNGIDTLSLLENGTFESKIWGKGSYQITRNFWSTEIDFSYATSMGNAGYATHLEKSILGGTKIWLDHDLGFYFEKMD